ncbi:MAG TPA: endonuclease/exonuclease/phosphatase family protein [Puia sp.]|nr:endonuclease/exonuclease/phosphatase family protein [Puia sp.]
MALLRKFTKRFVIIANIVVVILFLLACANSFLHPDKWWFISILGLFFPLLLLLVAGFFIFWLFFYSRKLALISLFALIIGLQNIHAFFAIHFASAHFAEKTPGSIRIMTWNIRYWDEFITKKSGTLGHRSKMFEFIREQNADVLCFQEFFEQHNPRDTFSNIRYIQQQLNYPYYFFSRDHRSSSGRFESGVIIFSRYPIRDTLQIKYSNEYKSGIESIIAADLDIQGKTVRVFTTHLQSVLFRNKDFHDIEIIKNVEDSMLEASKSIVKKLKRAVGLRGKQADIVRRELDNSPNPAIICGDFNDVPNSYTYFRIRGNRQDAFLQKGFGIGRTYIHLSPTLRIDYILCDKKFNVLQCAKFPLPYSDHHPVMADLQLP